MNVEGQWRPEGRNGRWRDISEEPAVAASENVHSQQVKPS